VGLGTLIILLTFVGFATFSPNGNEARPETVADTLPAPPFAALAADAGTATGRVTAFVFANQLQATIEPAVQTELTVALLTEQGRKPLSVTTTTAPPTTTGTVRRTTTTRRPPTTTTAPPATTTTTAPAVTTTTVPSSGPLTAGEMRALVEQFFPESEWEKAVLVARCESNYDPSAYNPAGPYGGLYQHSLAYWDGRAAAAGWAGASVYDATANTAVTAWLMNQGGWGHWPWCSAWADAQLGG
jgi:hypothetical protein